MERMFSTFLFQINYLWKFNEYKNFKNFYQFIILIISKLIFDFSNLV